LKEFTSFAEGEYSFPGDTVTYHGIIGTKADGSKEMLAIKFSDNPNYLKLSGTEVTKLANEACAAGECFEHRYFGNEMKPITWINASSTGIALSDEKKDEKGQVIATAQSELIITQSDDGYPRFIKLVVQIEDPANPEESLLRSDILYFLGFDVDYLSTKVLSLEELAKLPKGLQIKIGAESAKFLAASTIKGYPFFMDTFGSDSLYIETFDLFFSNHGKEAIGNNPIVILANAVKRK